MKRRLLLLLFLSAAIAPSRAAQGSNLDLTVGILERQYCRGDDETGFVRLRFRLTLSNVGSTAILFYRGAVNVSSVMLARSEQAYRERSYLVTYTPFRIAAETGEELVDRELLALGPGETRVLEGSGQFPLKTLPSGESSPGPGEYWLGIVATGDPLRPIPERWKRRPEVFIGTVRSSPVRLQIEPSPKFGRCR